MLTPLENEIRKWHDRKFPSGAPLEAYTAKLGEEVAELIIALSSGDEESIRDEAGDVGIVLTNLLRVVCPERPSLSLAMWASLKKINARLTAEPVGDRHGPHGRGGGD